MDKPKVIFVGGTVRSGTSLLNVVIANQKNAMALGEIIGLVSPVMKKHLHVVNKLKNDPIWSKIILGGKKRLYQNLFKYFPDVELFIDSSKEPLWIKYHTQRLKTCAEVKHVLIYKKVEDFLESFQKRGNGDYAARTYENYHKKYFKLVNNPVVISYDALITGSDLNLQAFKQLGLTFSRERLQFTREIKPNFFGSQRLQIKLRESGFRIEEKRQVDQKLIQPIKQRLINENKFSQLKKIELFLESKCNQTNLEYSISTYTSLEIQMIRLRDSLRNFYWSIFPR